MYDTTFFARRIIDSRTKREIFSDIGPHIMFTKCFGPGPYYKLTLKECSKSETPQCFGWKDFEQKKYSMIYPWKDAVEICLPYGSKAEKDRGKIVGFTIENYVEVNN